MESTLPRRAATHPAEAVVQDYERLTQLLARHAGSADAARELLHEAWLRLAHAPQGVAANASAYAYTTARHLLVDQQRHHNTRQAVEAAAVQEAATPADTTLHSAAHRQTLGTIEAALAALPQRTREVFLQHRLLEVPQAELAQRHRVSLATVEREIARAATALQAALDRWHGLPATRSQPSARRRGLGALLGLAGVLGSGGLLWRVWQAQVPQWQTAWRTLRNQQASHRLPDGSRITLDAQTALIAAYYGDRRQVVLGSGAAFFEVAADAGRPFSVDCGVVRVTVLGTRFSVERSGDRVRVDVEHGRVRVQRSSPAQTTAAMRWELAGGDGLVIAPPEPWRGAVGRAPSGDRCHLARRPAQLRSCAAVTDPRSPGALSPAPARSGPARCAVARHRGDPHRPGRCLAAPHAAPGGGRQGGGHGQGIAHRTAPLRYGDRRNLRVGSDGSRHGGFQPCAWRHTTMTTTKRVRHRPKTPASAGLRRQRSPLAKLAAMALLLASAGTTAAPVAFDIPAQALDRALALFARQAGLQLALPPALAQGRTGPAVIGSKEPADALVELLRGSGLRGRLEGGALVVERVPAPSAAADETVLPVVRVSASQEKETATGPVLGYAARQSATATKTDTPLRETPQSIAVVSREQIVDTGAATLDQALNYAAGVRSDIWGVSGRLDSPQIRGAEPSIFLDGLNNQVTYWTGSIPTEPYLLERVEVLRGPSSMLYGQSVASGLVNSVSKQPLAEAAREIGVTLGNHDRRQWQADLTGPLTPDGEWLYRLVALGRQSGTQVDFGRADRVLLAPSLTWRPNAGTQWTLRARWQRDRASGDSGNSLPWEGTILPNPNGRIARDAFLGEPNADRFDADNAQLGWTLTHQLNERWRFKQNLRWSDNQVDYASVYAYSPYLDDAQRLLNRYGYYWKRKARTVAADQNLEGAVETGEVKHRLLLGLDAMRFRIAGEDASDTPLSEGGTLAPIDAYAPSYDAGYSIPSYTRVPTSGIAQTGIYAQDQMRWGPWIGVLGLRHDRSTNWEDDSADRRDRATTRRAAVMLELAGGLVPYLSYSESFQPQANSSSGQRLQPLRGEQWELGMKFEPASRQWRASAAAYQLREKMRTVQVSPVDVLQTGQTKNTGVELEWVGRVAPGLDINANYAYTKVDAQLMGTPKHRAAVWGTYRLPLAGLPGIAVGLGVRHAGWFTDGEGTPTTPSATVMDAMLGWEGERVRVALNVSNLTDKTYLSNCWSWGECGYAAGRSVTLTANYRF